jgi:hypothetical protein
MLRAGEGTFPHLQYVIAHLLSSQFLFFFLLSLSVGYLRLFLLYDLNYCSLQGERAPLHSI